jgi:hypothetical protein
MKTSLNTYRLYCPNCTKVYYENTYEFTDNPIWLIKKKGPYGWFAGCPNFPKCKYSISLEPKQVFIDYEDELRPY